MSAQQQAGADRVAGLMQRFGCLPDAPDGPLLPAFAAKALAKAIEDEVNRGRIMGWSKLTLHMDLPDALALAKFLRK